MGLDSADPDDPTTKYVCSHPKKEHERFYRRWKFYALVINTLTLAAVVLYACEAHKQTSKLSESAKTARDSLDAFEAVQAARLSFETPKMEIVRTQAGDFGIKVTLPVHNTGETSAEGIGLHKQQKFDLSNCPPGNIPLGKPNKNGITIGHGETKEFPYFVDQGTKEKMRDKEQSIMLLPRVQYTDVFGNPHITSDCFMYSQSRKFNVAPTLEHCSCLVQTD